MRTIPIPNAAADFATHGNTPSEGPRKSTAKVNTATLSLHLVLCMLSVVYSCIEFGPVWSVYLGGALKVVGLDGVIMPIIASTGAWVYHMIEEHQLLPVQVAMQVDKLLTALPLVGQ